MRRGLSEDLVPGSAGGLGGLEWRGCLGGRAVHAGSGIRRVLVDVLVVVQVLTGAVVGV